MDGATERDALTGQLITGQSLSGRPHQYHARNGDPRGSKLTFSKGLLAMAKDTQAPLYVRVAALMTFKATRRKCQVARCPEKPLPGHRAV